MGQYADAGGIFGRTGSLSIKINYIKVKKVERIRKDSNLKDFI